MGVAQARPAALPVKQVIAFVYLGGGESRRGPGLDARLEFVAVEELPVGEDEAAVICKQIVDGAE